MFARIRLFHNAQLDRLATLAAKSRAYFADANLNAGLVRDFSGTT